MNSLSFDALRTMLRADPLTPDQWQALNRLSPDGTPRATDRLLALPVVAGRLGMSERHAKRLARDGVLPAVRLGRRCVRYRESDVARLIVDGLPAGRGSDEQ